MFPWKWKWKLSRLVMSDSLWPLSGSADHGIFLARMLEWVAISFSRGSSWPRDQTQVFCTAGRWFTIWATRGVSNFLEEISSVFHSVVFLYFFELFTKEDFLSVLPILWNSAFGWVYLCLSPLTFTSLFSAICKASSHNHFALLLFFFLGMVLVTASLQCYKPPSIVLQALYLSDLIPWICLSLPLYKRKGFDLGHTWMV